MRKLVLLYKDVLENQISIKEYSIVEEQGKYFIFDDKNPYSKTGILKKYINHICSLKDYPNTYPIELPYIVDKYWRDIVFMFVNKNKYDKNPINYIDMMKNYNNT